MTPARSWLYVPAHDERKIAKARTAGADAVILDLEDGTPADSKEIARDLVARELADRPGPARYWVRINAVEPGTGWQDDLATARTAHGVVIPKVSRPDQVHAVHDRSGDLELAPIVTENAAGVLAMERTLTAAPTVRTAFWGAEDLRADLGARANRDDRGELLDVFRVVRSLFLVQCAAAGVAAVDTPCLDIRDLAAVATDSRAAYLLGFAGKQVIHPAHVRGVNAGFLPTPEEVAAAQEVVAAFGDRDGGAYRVAGAMVDQPHLRSAKLVLARATEAGER
ncbi:HpcH/HpaI aldolase/citrate lyase family protein [Actinophytocola algeriensis]|uniref:Citrate lyase subunit beta/citryl-CoA lyase n=1 Tax=Actinophytocola algeriensis TaxID=1768010 RepID=A0A7W7QF89_9PSEU|nr:CoA ester lyase [Actinophytocola algeriensis]MBB4912244.1 citrate lyase subunit beta/citryl-CoA lyase [Actinophytocola algeriensis]MBE1474240.1 citrate lyase subunit beta/citryl-CoA lyase [Actinophytocola algeriensis]